MGAADETRAAQGAADATQAERWPGREHWAPGDQIDHYTIVRELGSGGMGVVYLATDTRSGALRALKALPLTASDTLQARFEREGIAQARVGRHPHVVQVHATGRASANGYLVMDYAPAGTLEERIGDGLPPREAATIARDLAKGLTHLHALGVLHRDLKPANVLFDEEGRPQLVDFGLARLMDAEALTQTGTSLGTPAYMAPEQVNNDRGAVGPASDVYGLGGVLFHMLCGVPPFTGPSSAEVLVRVVNERAPAPRSLRPAVPQALEAICVRCLAKRPEDRFANAEELVGALEAFMSGESPQANSRPALAASVVTILLAVAALAWVLSPVEAPRLGPAARPRVAAVTTEVTPSLPLELSLVVDQARAAAKAGRWELALDQYEYVLKRAPKAGRPLAETVAELYVAYSVRMRLRREDEIAFEAVTRSLELRPHDLEALVLRGRVLKSLGRSREAIKDFDRAIEIDPSRGYFYESRGACYRNLRLSELAIADYRRALSLSASSPERAKLERLILLTQSERAEREAAAE